MLALHYLLASVLMMAAAVPLCSAEPVLDLRAKDNLRDTSKFARELHLEGDLQLANDHSIRFTKANAITIAYSKDDPLFGQGACTYILRCKVGQLFHGTPYSVAGRWDYAGNQRVISLTISGDRGCPRFQLSADGRAEGGLGAVQQNPIPGKEWVNIVGRFEPGETLSCRTYDDASGALCNEGIARKEIMFHLNNLTAPFLVGAPKDVEMDFARLRVWNTALSDAEIRAALAEK